MSATQLLLADKMAPSVPALQLMANLHRVGGLSCDGMALGEPCGRFRTATQAHASYYCLQASRVTSWFLLKILHERLASKSVLVI